MPLLQGGGVLLRNTYGEARAQSLQGLGCLGASGVTPVASGFTVEGGDCLDISHKNA